MSKGIIVLLVAISFVVGIFFEGYIFCFSCTSSKSSLDINGDGVIDYWQEYDGDYLTLTKEDRNFDGKYDFVTSFKLGIPEYSKADDNFDGVDETYFEYEEGKVSKILVNTNDDIFVDLIMHYKHGVLQEMEFVEGKTGKKIKTDKVYLNLTEEQALYLKQK